MASRFVGVALIPCHRWIRWSGGWTARFFLRPSQHCKMWGGKCLTLCVAELVPLLQQPADVKLRPPAASLSALEMDECWERGHGFQLAIECADPVVPSPFLLWKLLILASRPSIVYRLKMMGRRRIFSGARRPPPSRWNLHRALFWEAEDPDSYMAAAVGGFLLIVRIRLKSFSIASRSSLSLWNIIARPSSAPPFSVLIGKRRRRRVGQQAPALNLIVETDVSVLSICLERIIGRPTITSR